MDDPAQDVFEPGRMIADDMCCARCGYNLRGLTYDGRCPECGTPTARSVHGNLLRYADPGWLGRIRFGIVLKLWNLLIGVLIGVSSVAVTMIGLPVVLIQLAGLVGACLGLSALFLVTTPEPMVGSSEAMVTLRRIIRTMAVFGFVGGQLQGLTPNVGGGVTVYVVASILALAGVVSVFGEFVYVRRFARRIPDEKLAKSTTVVMWGLVTILAFGAVSGLAFVVASASLVAGGATGTAGGAGPGGFVSVYMFGMCLFSLGAIIFGVWYIALLFRYHGAFKTALAQARELQRQEGAPSAHPAPHETS